MQQLLAVSGVLAMVGGVNAAPPSWWSSADQPVIDPAAEVNNYGMANIGQAKWMAKRALGALRATQPATADAIEAELVGMGKPIASWDAPTTQEQRDAQRAPLLIGQLKAIAAPFYSELHEASPIWLEAELVTNQTKDGSDSQNYFPWTSIATDDSNKACATIGQLKAVFSLRFETLVLDADGDEIPDAWEQMLIEQSEDPSSKTLEDIVPGDDFDGDGVSNWQEYQRGLSGYQVDSDGDGYSDRLSVDQCLRLSLDETSGTLARDSSDNHRDGTLVSSPAWQSTGGVASGALQFHGGTDAVTLPASVLNGAGDLTLSLWFKTTSAATNQCLFSAAGSTQAAELALSLENSTTLRFHTGGGNSVTWACGRSLANGLWHHVILTRNVTSGQVALQLDGAPFEAAQAVSLGTLTVDALTLGQRHQTVSTYDATKAFSGHLDEIRIYSAVLPADNLTELFQPNDLDLDGLPDDYEKALFGNLTTLASAADDLDGDGLTNRQELEGGNDPNDYYNGQPPVITLVSGSGQTIYNRQSTSAPLVFLVARNGTPLVNAPVLLSHLELIGGIETLDGDTSATSLTLRSDAEGKISVHFKAD
jgi:hypothetical protein